MSNEVLSDPAVADPPAAVGAAVGCMVTRLVVDDAATVHLRGRDRELTLRIDGRGLLRSSDGECPIDPDLDLASVGCLLPLMHHPVTRTELLRSGTLRLQIGRWVLELLPHEHQISWSLRTDTGASTCCLAEGFVVWE